MICGGPIAQTFQNHLTHNRVITIQRITTTAKIIIVSLRCQHIVYVVIKALKGKAWAHFISFCRMVKYHVQNTFDTIFMKLPNQFLQLGTFFVIFLHCRIAGIWCKKADCIIAPVIHYRLAVYHPVILHFVKLKNGHQLHSVNTKLFQIRNLFFKSRKGSRTNYSGRRMTGKSPDMKLINNQIIHRD